ncbi:phosphatidate cytidylyltransferase [Methylocystis bryophila]|uniref:Phosphatidate cytidylyltransferase n=1 Tax=Methylocystis bryophila TaxID=655015 RepID=A0A1W6MZN6_9HYPH|nr:phosphatidate cytidylyltransferase [Methylocystis bryophila]ARN83057.1 phosphatidate cytidylyltransferase [Methylocystis bryophila]BDV39366.1 phosphatidate cytidylyltransferase [Methylocystis bryophila]
MSATAQEGAAPPKSGGFGDLGPRVASAVVLVTMAAGTAFCGGSVFALFWLVVACAVVWEWQGLIGGERQLARVGLGWLALAAAALLIQGETPFVCSVAIGFLCAAVGLLTCRGRRIWASSGVLYAAALVLSVDLLRQSGDKGAIAIAWLFAIVWGADVFAYFGGRLIGGPKLWPRVSAGKTWSGAVVGALSGAALGAFVARVFAGASVAPMFLVSLAAVILSQLGDLFESAVKRRFDVKDSSRLIPGHGGVMDRVDGFIFAAIFAAALGVLRDPSSAASGLFSW